MKTFTTAVNLTEKQAKESIACTFAAHFPSHEGLKKLSPDSLENLTNPMPLEHQPEDFLYYDKYSDVM